MPSLVVEMEDIESRLTAFPLPFDDVDGCVVKSFESSSSSSAAPSKVNARDDRVLLTGCLRPLACSGASPALRADRRVAVPNLSVRLHNRQSFGAHGTL